MPHIQANKHIKELDSALEAYLEAIHYVLAEVIGEINFEYTYDPEGNERMIFIPSDPEVRKKLDEYARGKGGPVYSEEALKSKAASAFSPKYAKWWNPAKQQFLPDPAYRRLT